MASLIIVESFAKTKTISRYLGDGYTVICSLGHFKDLPSKELGIDTSTWKGSYVVTNKKIAKNIRDKVKLHDTIYIASDPDVEGEAIAYHIGDLIKDLVKKKECYRISFNEISRSSILEAIKNRGCIDMRTVMAQEARRFVDRLVGYRLSPFLWSRFKNYKLSVGRVQSIALSLCANPREAEDVSIYWTIRTVDTLKLDMAYHENSKVIKYYDEKSLLDALDMLDIGHVPVVESKEKPSVQCPPPPYTTTSMQQDAYSTFKFGAKRTMKLAQDLYEAGMITYMRTDSVAISVDFTRKIVEYVRDKYGNAMVSQREYKSKSNAQEAHEAVRITDIISVCPGELSADHNKLYGMVWKRTVASQMAGAGYVNVEIMLKFANSVGYFSCTKSFLVDVNYLVLYGKEACNVEGFVSKVGSVRVQKLSCQASFDGASPYNEIGLIRRLEKEGIGRPSTYSTIMDKLLEKQYAIVGKLPDRTVASSDYVKSVGGVCKSPRDVNVSCKGKDILIQTDLGIDVIGYMNATLPFIMDISFTRDMEKDLENIINDKDTKEEVLNRFYCSYIEPVCSSLY